MILQSAPDDTTLEGGLALASAASAFYASVSVCSSSADGAPAGGDWCEVLALSEHVDVLTIGDVSGHGASVADVMVTMRDAVLRACRDTHVPSDVLANVNALALTRTEGRLVSAIVAVLDHREHTLTFANAGHPPPLLLNGDVSAFLEGPVGDLPLGVFPTYHAADYVIALPRDALLVLYTDGITEHNRDPIMGERELLAGARLAYARTDLNLARMIAQHVFASGRGKDDAATMALRTTILGGRVEPLLGSAHPRASRMLQTSSHSRRTSAAAVSAAGVP